MIMVISLQNSQACGKSLVSTLQLAGHLNAMVGPIWEAQELSLSSGYMKKTYMNLVPHDILYMSFDFFLSGVWQPYDSFSVDIDGVSSISWSLGPQITSMASKTCPGMLSKSFFSSVIGKVFHAVGRVTATIHFSVSETAGTTHPSISIRNFVLMARQSQPDDKEGFYVTIQDNTVQNSTKCNARNYLSASVCTPCTTTNCELCNGVGDVNCVRAGWATFDSGSGYSKCASNCEFCIDSAVNSCVQCWRFYVLDYDNTCRSSCTPPYQPRGKNAKKCLMPCDATQYLYWNNTCRDSCNPPLQIDDTTQQCTYPCNKAYDEFLYWDGSCLATCPFLRRNESGYAFCDACAEGYFFYPDDGGICKLGCNYPYIVKDIVYCRLDLSQSDLEQAKTISNVTSVTSQTLSIGCSLLNLFNPSDPSALTLAAITNMLLYTRYMDLKYPPKLQSVLDQQTTNQPSIKFLRVAQDLLKNHLPSTPLPGRFDHYGLHSKFLVNFIQPLFILSTILAITLILCLIKYFYKKENTFRALACKAVDSLRWNLLITLFVSNYDGIILYGSLEIWTMSAGGSFLYILSYLIATIMLLVIFLVVAKTISIISRIRRAVAQQTSENLRTERLTDFKNTNKGYQVVYEAFKDSGLMQQSFFLIFTSRLILFHIIVADLIYHPFIQAILILLMNIGMILYLCLKYPIKSKLRLGQYIIQELLLLVANICVLIVASLDLSPKEDDSTKKIAGEIFLYMNMVLSMLGPVFLVLIVIEKLIALKRGQKSSQSSQVRPMNENALPVNIMTRAPQGCLQTNNESNLVLAQEGLNQSQIGDTSLNQTDLQLIAQCDRQSTNIVRSNRKKAQKGITYDHNTLNESIHQQKQTHEARVDQSGIYELSLETSNAGEMIDSVMRNKNIYDSNNLLTINQSALEDLSISKRKKQDKPQPSLNAQQYEESKGMNINYDGNASNKDEAPSNVRSGTEATWLRVNRGRRYRIRGLGQDFNSLEKNGMEIVEDGKYINEPTYGNHSGIINSLKIKQPDNLKLQ